MNNIIEILRMSIELDNKEQSKKLIEVAISMIEDQLKRSEKFGKLGGMLASRNGLAGRHKRIAPEIEEEKTVIERNLFANR